MRRSTYLCLLIWKYEKRGNKRVSQGKSEPQLEYFGALVTPRGASRDCPEGCRGLSALLEILLFPPPSSSSALLDLPTSPLHTVPQDKDIFVILKNNQNYQNIFFVLLSFGILYPNISIISVFFYNFKHYFLKFDISRILKFLLFWQKSKLYSITQSKKNIFSYPLLKQ